MWWVVAGRRLSWMCGRKSSTLCLWSRCFTTLCRRWWNSWWTFSHLSISVLPSRSSKYPDRLSTPRCSHSPPCAADGGTASADCGAERRHSGSWWWRATQIFKVFSVDRVQSTRAEQIVDIPCGGLQDFRPGQSSSSSSHFPAGILGDADEPGEGFFRTFNQHKKSAKLGPHSSPRVHASVSSSTPAPQRIRLNGTAARERHAGKWRTDTGLPGGCGLMATMVRSSRRLTACDVVVGTSL